MKSSPPRQLIRIAIPMIGASIVSMFASVIGMLFVAKLGRDQLAAGALVSSTYVTLLVFATASLYATSILIAGISKEETLAIRQVFHTACCVGFLLALFVGVLFYFSGDIFYFFHQRPDLIVLAEQYFHRMIFALIFIILFMVLQQYFIGTERPHINLAVTLISLVITIFFSYILVLGKYGFPTLGLKGLAYAQILSLIVSCGLCFFHLYQSGDQQKYHLITWKLTVDYATGLRILKIGLPIGIQYAAELASLSLATYFMGWLGTDVLGASQISSQVSLLAVMIFLAISQASSVLVSQSISQQAPSRAMAYHKAAILFGFSLMCVVLFLFVSVPTFLIHFYVNVHLPANQFIVQQAKILLAISGVVLIFDAIRNITAGSLRGLHDSHTPMLWSIFFQWIIALPLAYIFGFILHWGAGGIRLGFVIGFALCAVVLWCRFSKKMKKLLIFQSHRGETITPNTTAV